MLGVVLIIIAMVLAFPVAVMLGGAVWSAVIGWLASDEADAAAAGENGEPEKASA